MGVFGAVDGPRFKLKTTMQKNYRRNWLTAQAVGSLIESLEQRRLFSGYYVDASVPTDGNGSQAAPWNQLSDVSKFQGFQSGDVVNLAGTFTNQTLYLGLIDAGITITSTDPTHPAVISETAGFNFTGAVEVATSNVTVSDLNLIGPGVTSSSNSYYGLWFDNFRTIQLTGGLVTNINESGFVFAGLQIQGTTKGFTGLTVTNSNFSNNQVSGIVVDGPSTSYIHSNLVISNCITSDNAGAAIWYNANTGGTENSSNGGIFISSVNGAIVEHCIAIGNCYNSAGACGIWAFNAKVVTFEYDECDQTKTDKFQWDGNGFDFDFNVSDSLMQYDYAYGNAGAGMYICTYNGTANDAGDTIRYCISDNNSNCGDPGILVYSSGAHPVLGAEIYNNTVLCDGSAGSEGIGVTGPGGAITTVSFLNNIVYGVNNALLVDCTDFTPNWSNLYFEGNDYWDAGSNHFTGLGGSTTYTSMSSWIASTREETLSGTIVGMNVDPQLANETVGNLPIGMITDFELSPDSVLVGTALDLTMSPFISSVPYTTYAPYNLGGSAWNGLGTQDYFGFDVDPSNENVGANTTENLTVNSGVQTAPQGVPGTVSTATFSNVNISAGAEVVAANSSGSSAAMLNVVTASLNLAGTTDAWTGTLDLGSDDLMVRNGNLATLTDQVAQGYNNGWQPGGGIIRSAAASDTTNLTTLGVIQNSTTGDPAGPALFSSFDSSSASSTDVLVKYTYFGDANLDGVVDGTDYSRIDNGYIGQLTGWYNGDFNYDGVIDGSDYTLIDNAYNTQGPSMAAQTAGPLASPTAQLG